MGISQGVNFVNWVSSFNVANIFCGKTFDEINVFFWSLIEYSYNDFGYLTRQSKETLESLTLGKTSFCSSEDFRGPLKKRSYRHKWKSESSLVEGWMSTSNMSGSFGRGFFHKITDFSDSVSVKIVYGSFRRVHGTGILFN